MTEERVLLLALAGIARRRNLNLESNAVARRAMALVVMRNRGLTPMSGRRKI